MKNLKHLAAQNFLGWGNYRAPYYFVGMEPGGEHGQRFYTSWAKLGCGELVDRYRQHVILNPDDYERTLQAASQTWMKLLWLLFSYEGRPIVKEEVRRVQREEWGTSDGCACIMNLSGVQAKSTNVKVDRSLYRDERIAKIRKRIIEHCPKFVVFLGLTLRSDYEKVVGCQFDDKGFAMMNRGSTVCILVTHPNSRYTSTKKYWINRGRALNRRTQ
jgi:hypothetical protein